MEEPRLNRDNIMNIRKIRVEKGMSQKDFADSVGVLQSVVCMWESGASMPRTRDLPAIANVLDCSIDKLFISPEATSQIEIDAGRKEA